MTAQEHEKAQRDVYLNDWKKHPYTKFFIIDLKQLRDEKLKQVTMQADNMGICEVHIRMLLVEARLIEKIISDYGT